MTNKWKRKELETENVFADPKYARQAWKSVGYAILQNPASEPITASDKDGNETYASMVERYTFGKLAKDLEQIGEPNRKPTELEMIMACQIVKARHDTAAATFVRDTLGAKPIDESKVQADINNPYESLTDEELELIAKHRDEVAKQSEANDEEIPQ